MSYLVEKILKEAIQNELTNLFNNKDLKKMLSGELMGRDTSKLNSLFETLKSLKDKYPKQLIPKQTIFYRVDTIEKSEELENLILEDAMPVKNFLLSGTRLHGDKLSNCTYSPKNNIQSWTVDEDFVWEHWYNVYIHGQSKDFSFDSEKYYPAIYITKNSEDMIFDTDFLDTLKEKLGGQQGEGEVIRYSQKPLNCEVIIIS